MNNFDFNPHNVTASSEYDGFVDCAGNYYRVKEKGSSTSDHSVWAEQFLKANLNLPKLQINPNYSTLFSLMNSTDFSELLINFFGFAYYNHDSLYLKPIVKLPNPAIAGRKATSEQIESLIKIMDINRENPYNLEFLIDSNMFYYNGVDEEGCIKK